MYSRQLLPTRWAGRPSAAKHMDVLERLALPSALISIDNVHGGISVVEGSISFPCSRVIQNKILSDKVFYASGRICGNSNTSRIDGASVNNITSRSIPIPSPAVGGMPCSSAVI